MSETTPRWPDARIFHDKGKTVALVTAAEKGEKSMAELAKRLGVSAVYLRELRRQNRDSMSYSLQVLMEIVSGQVPKEALTGAAADTLRREVMTEALDQVRTASSLEEAIARLEALLEE